MKDVMKIRNLVQAVVSGKSVLTAALLFSLATAFAQDAEIRAAQQLFNKDKKKGAIELLQKATATYPQAANLYYHLGHTQILTGDLTGAKASFDKGAEVNPKEPLNFVGLGYLLVLQKNIAQAKVQFDKAIALGKKNVATLNAIAEAYLTDKAYEKDAMVLLQRSKELKPENAETYILLGDAYLLEVNGGSSASSYERASDLNPSSALPWFKLGELFKRSDITMTEEKLKKAVEVDHDFAIANRELGELYYRKKDGPNAVKYYKTYLDLTDSPEKDDRFRYAFFLFLAKDYENANKEFEQLAKKTDVSSTTLKFYAQSLLKANRLDDCQKIFERYLAHPQTKVEADDYSNYGDLFVKLGKDSLAANAYEQSLNLDANQPDVLKTLTDYYFSKVKKYDQAERICRKAIKVRKAPQTLDYFTLGRALYIQKKYPQADSAFAKVIELQPKAPFGYNWAARSKSAQDEELKDALAKPYYEKVIELGESTPDKNKNELIAAYQYMGSYHLLKQENSTAKSYFEKVLVLNPDDANAKEAIKLINTPPQQQKPKKR